MTEEANARYPQAMAAFPELRQSTLSSFDACALSAHFDYEHRRGWNSGPQSRGTVFHRYAAACLRAMHGLDEEEIPVDAALGIMRDVLRQDDVDRVCPECGTTDIKKGLSAEGQRRCAAGHLFETEFVNLPLSDVKDLYWIAVKWAHDNAWDIRNLVDVEMQLRAPVSYPGLVGGSVVRRLKGTVDALFIEGANAEHAIVLDWKDTWGLPPERVEGKDDGLSSLGYFQQRFYAWLIFMCFPTVDVVTLREFYVRYSQPREATIRREHLEEIQSELAAVAERFDRAFEEQVFPPTAGKHCAFCTRPMACPIPVFAREEGRIIDAERAQQVARQVTVAEEVLKRARKDLRAYVTVHGPVPIADGKGPREYGYEAKVRTVKPTFEEIREAEVRKGAPLSSVEIKAMYKSLSGTRFSAHVVRDVEEDTTVSDAELQRALEESIKAGKRRVGAKDKAA